MSRRDAAYEALRKLPTLDIAFAMIAVLVEEHKGQPPINTVYGMIATTAEMARQLGRDDLADELIGLLPQKRDQGPIVNYMDEHVSIE
jgi:hypothetical protein